MSSNGGATWRDISIPGVGSWVGMAMSDDGQRLVVSQMINYDPGWLFASTDSGKEKLLETHGR